MKTNVTLILYTVCFTELMESFKIFFHIPYFRLILQ